MGNPEVEIGNSFSGGLIIQGDRPSHLGGGKQGIVLTPHQSITLLKLLQEQLTTEYSNISGVK